MQTETKVYKERLKFYADTPSERNKYFCWSLTSILNLKDALWRFFDKGWNIRSAWYEKIEQGTGKITENSRLNIRELHDEYLDQKQFLAKNRTHSH